MNIDGLYHSSPYIPLHTKPREEIIVPESIWMSTDIVPVINTVAPVWDGQYLYYAAYFGKGGPQVWVVVEQMGINLDDIHLRKKHGDIVEVKAWMKIEAPR